MGKMELSEYCNFWYEFDKKFNGGFYKVDQNLKPIRINGELQTIADKNYIKMMGNVMGKTVNSFNTSYDKNMHRLDISKFKNKIKDIADDIRLLSDDQLGFINNYFHGNKENEQLAFEYFGQGVLYDMQHDNERVGPSPDSTEFVTYRVHKIDTDGMYRVWHMIIRATISLDISVDVWLRIHRFIAIAYLLNSVVSPLQSFDFPSGPGPENIPEKQKISWRDNNGSLLENLRSRVQNASGDELDPVFIHD
jgi:hypothetical protein